MGFHTGTQNVLFEEKAMLFYNPNFKNVAQNNLAFC